ncbi:MAG: orotate phosphoribosyltransferase [Candidatus Thioglobus sp.]|jgi:orotate phosphoribosyltransferase|nr:orotate phosphoribosyltransferase [Gammaproteobacteria bacterium]MDP6163868.1 orotate phosphoribosyltransferase [Candidatus Thioglobus sp.]MBQ08419.1 orotate phosphoribosyltransferase [Gammaproteobacteria bacterium]HJL80351.1 orotate phosphoribosyltransferase [Gammaproteobacteria bacterium]HJM09699.1 orotate phosphoribosyltransferase [Gammaproteobacteria bacterium]|tara:strand:+ start:6152 stop:6796 length:645 start_codon:yes stop_codon:yes gene_type:complete
MENYKQKFIRMSIQIGALKFGEFELKSGRVSPYFFNMGLFSTGEAIKNIGDCYASALEESVIEYDMIFGPAYKGIPLVSVLASSLSMNHGKDVPFVYNRKEKKDHGEGGETVGPALSDKVVIVDDVITAGTAIKEASQIIQGAGAEISGILIALDRQEKGVGDLSAVEEVSSDLQVPVISIVDLGQVLVFLKNNPSELEAHVEAIENYRKKYGV